VTRSNQRSIEPQGSARPSAERERAEVAYARRLQAVERLATDLLSSIETAIKENPSAVAEGRGTVLPREIEDRQAYFLQKTSQARIAIADLSNLLGVRSEAFDYRELISAELLMLFALIEACRPERMIELGWHPDKNARQAVAATLESLGLSIINMRERLR